MLVRSGGKGTLTPGVWTGADTMENVLFIEPVCASLPLDLIIKWAFYYENVFIASHFLESRIPIIRDHNNDIGAIRIHRFSLLFA